MRVRKSDVDEKKNTINITFVVDEGENIKIAKINLLGVTKADPEDVLAVLELEEDGFIADGTFKNDTFEKDKNSILNFTRIRVFSTSNLKTHGMTTAGETRRHKKSVLSSLPTRLKKASNTSIMVMTSPSDERFLNPTTKKQLFSRDKIEEFFEYTTGDVVRFLDNGKFNRDRGIVNYLYSQEGYIYARVQPERTVITLTKEAIEEKRNSVQQKESEQKGGDYYNLKRLTKLLENSPELKGKKFVHTKFVIAEGDKGYIENIVIKGNKKDPRQGYPPRTDYP